MNDLQPGGLSLPRPVARAPSIRAQLLVWLAAGLTIAIVAAIIATYLRAREEANQLFDLQLQQTAASITGMPFAPERMGQTQAGEGLVVQIWDRSGVRLYLPPPASEQPAQRLPRHTPGFATIDTPSGAYRVFSVLANGQLVQIGQPLAVRRELAASLALRTIFPLLVTVPFLLAFVWFAIARSLAPLTRLAGAVARRSPTKLEPVPDGNWPSEALPLVAELNNLLRRLGATLDSQRALVADAAHELRSPLAALHLQAQLAERAKTSDERASALADLKRGLLRATRMVEQLLSLAREESGVADEPSAPVDIVALAKEVVSELSPLAEAKTLDLGVEAPPSVHVIGDGASLRTMLTNLVDNAIRYTPSGGRIDVAVEREREAVVLAVRDSGPGIAPEARERMFGRFVRGGDSSVSGSGLGLAIVQRVAERHGATVELADGPGGRGLAVLVRFPAAAP